MLKLFTYLSVSWKKCNPPLVVQLLPIFHYSVSIKVLLFFFKIRNVYKKDGTNLWDDLIVYLKKYGIYKTKKKRISHPQTM
ncbi:hypothetical protein A7N06_19760 [Acinetobacter baumannii]|nr:hypothetical protein A7N06_19760 [Acinetobacter baumannii]